ncbi:hypothetical protein [Dyadobacter tibetensis]|uniref:hypothetical protein n=1 Tax=Dyadobacter tibetensis TaxID=1211851 RepID=UPI0004B09C0E|nr:hypothetical protein [Dyadobacter tibetensis]
MRISGILVKISFLWVEGMALYPFVLSRSTDPDPVLLNHERIHLRQQIEMGILLFYLWYLIEYLIGIIKLKSHYQAYRAISFEREAFLNEKNFEYLNERRHWSFLRFMKG